MTTFDATATFAQLWSKSTYFYTYISWAQMSLLRKSLLLLWGRCCTKVVIAFSAPSAGMPFQPKNSIIGNLRKKCSRRLNLPFKFKFFLPKRWKAILAQELNNRRPLKKVVQKADFWLKIVFFDTNRSSPIIPILALYHPYVAPSLLCIILALHHPCFAWSMININDRWWITIND